MIEYKAQLLETAERGKVNFIIEAKVENNASRDNSYASQVVAKLADKDIKPKTLYVDQGYTAGSEVATCEEVRLIKHELGRVIFNLFLDINRY